MRMMNNHPLDLEGNNGERITVTAVPRLQGDTVAFALEGKKGGALPQPFTFVLNSQRADPSVLTLVFTFVGQGGGFDITVTGNAPGSQTSFFFFDQFTRKVGSISYSIDVV